MNWSPKRWALLLACVAVLTFIVILGRTESGKAYAKTSWEYKVVHQGDRLPSGMEDPERGLNQLGMDGWELVYFMRNDQGAELQGTWIFKRPK
jgi:hypothetical protein